MSSKYVTEEKIHSQHNIQIISIIMNAQLCGVNIFA